MVLNNLQRQGFSQYNPVYEFPYQIQNQHVQMVFTSVTGHLMELDFDASVRCVSSLCICVLLLSGLCLKLQSLTCCCFIRLQELVLVQPDRAFHSEGNEEDAQRRDAEEDREDALERSAPEPGAFESISCALARPPF